MPDTAQAYNLESDQDYLALVAAAAGKPESHMGGAVKPAEPPLWAEVYARARKLLGNPPHLSILVYLVKANVHMNSFGGVADSFQELYESLSKNWDTLIPGPDADDEPLNRYYERVNILFDLTEGPDFLGALHRSEVVSLKGIGGFSFRDIEISNGQLKVTEDERARCQEQHIRAAFGEVPAETLSHTANCIKKIIECCGNLQRLFDDRAGPEHELTTVDLVSQLTGYQEKMIDYAGQKLPLAVSPQPNADSLHSDQYEDSASSQTKAHRQPEASEQLDRRKENTLALIECQYSSRNEVVVAFNQVIEYYRSTEPSSPVLVLAQRSRDLVSLGFFQLLQELSGGCNSGFEACISTLGDKPLAHLVKNSYERFMKSTEQGTLSSSEGSAISDTSGAGAVSSRSDVLTVLSQIELFFVQTEPSSPIPLVVAEIRSLVPKTFIQLIEEFNTLEPNNTGRTSSDSVVNSTADDA